MPFQTEGTPSYLQESIHQEMHFGAKQVLTGTALVLLSLFGFLVCVRFGLARLLVKYAATAGNISAADKAVSLAPADPESHYTRGALFSNLGQPDIALKEIERAVSLRPRDYYLWLQLGMVRDQLEDQVGALADLDEAARLAPYYSQPRWQRGNLLFRMGRTQEAFADLRHAASSEPNLLPNLIDLAWSASAQDAAVTERILSFDSSSTHMALAQFYAARGKATEALAQYRAVGSPAEKDRRELVRQLIRMAAFREAFQIWSSREASAGEKSPLPVAVYDGGFEGPLNLNEAGFGWRVARGLGGLNMSVDSGQPHTGAKSLRLEFKGNTSTATDLLSQLLVLEPATRYQVNFAARTREIVTGGPLVLTIAEATGDKHLLARSMPLRQGSNNWETYTVDFSTTASTGAVLVTIQRESCTSSPCPIFGVIWFDSFSIQELR